MTGISTKNKYKAIIFDLDGTLLDSLSDYAAATNKVLKDFAFPVHAVDSYRYFFSQCEPVQKVESKFMAIIRKKKMRGWKSGVGSRKYRGCK